MTVRINASTAGLVETVDTSGILEFQTANTAAIIIDASQNANFTSTGAVTLPVGTTEQRPTGVNGMLRYNSSFGLVEGYITNAWTAVTGYYTFTGSYLAVAGGGAGGGNIGAGGGAGGFLTGSTTFSKGTTYTITVGAGGTGAPTSTPFSGTNGGNSSISTVVTAIGGGYGGNQSGSAAGGRGRLGSA